MRHVFGSLAASIGGIKLCVPFHPPLFYLISIVSRESFKDNFPKLRLNPQKRASRTLQIVSNVDRKIIKKKDRLLLSKSPPHKQEKHNKRETNKLKNI